MRAEELLSKPFLLIHVGIGSGAEFFHGVRVVGINPHADTGSHRQAHCSQNNRFVQVRSQFSGQDARTVRLQQIGNYHHELISAGSGNRVGFADSHLQSRGDNAQDLIADWMSVGVIDLFEVIQVNE